MSERKRLRLLIRHFYENGLKFMLENPGNVHDLLQMLDVKLLPRIDFAKMRVVPGRFVGRDYRHLESDLVLQARVRPGPGDKHRQIILYILIEHQSGWNCFPTSRRSSIMSGRCWNGNPSSIKWPTPYGTMPTVRRSLLWARQSQRA
jgi:hypothetical protein